LLIADHTRAHLENVHKIAEQSSDLSRNRGSAGFQQQPDTPHEGIDHSKWVQIENILKVKRDKGKDKSDIDKWFDLWEVLFPNIPTPAHPCEYMSEASLVACH
jgi:hypothetical protein